MYIEYLECGMPYTWNLAGPNGANFTLFPLPGYTPEDMKKAVAEIKRTRDAVSIHVASESDLDYRYGSEIFAHPLVRPLRWYQITQEVELIRKCRKSGMPVEEYVQTIVLPNVEKCEAKWVARSGQSIYTY